MRKLLLCASAIAAVILAGSCQKEVDKATGQMSEATFTVDLPVGLATRAIGDGTTATELYYGVFTEEGEYLQGLAQSQPVLVTDKTASFSLPLVRNFTYTVVFWAQAPDAPYTFDPEEGVVTVDYSGDANDESRDAFCQVHTFTVPDRASFSETVYLSRPFAQINFGASDYSQIAELGLSMESTVSISGIADTYDILNGVVSGNASTSMALTAVPAQFNPKEVLTVQGEDYGYVSMCYILAPVNEYDAAGNVIVEHRELTNIKATFAYNNDTVTVEVANVPFQRNYRTNIIGSFFTDVVTFDVIVDENFIKPDIDSTI